MRHNISDIGKKHNAVRSSAGDNYINVKCGRCGSASQLLVNNVITDAVICPVCHEGEIDIKARHMAAVHDRTVDELFGGLKPYILTSSRPSPN